MSAATHATAANDNAVRLSIALQSLCDAALRGEVPTVEQLADTHRAAAHVQYLTALTLHSVARLPAPERREIAEVAHAL